MGDAEFSLKSGPRGRRGQAEKLGCTTNHLVLPNLLVRSLGNCYYGLAIVKGQLYRMCHRNLSSGLELTAPFEMVHE